MTQPSILFLCTANYYRSRFAELYFNHLAEKEGFGLRADSAALEMEKWRSYNPGDISIHTLNAMKDLGFPHLGIPRAPKQFDPSQLGTIHRCIAMCESEHRPMVLRDHPELVDQIEYWAVEDVEFEAVDSAIKRIRTLVESLLHELLGDSPKEL